MSVITRVRKIKLCCPVGTGRGVRKSVILARVSNSGSLFQSNVVIFAGDSEAVRISGVSVIDSDKRKWSKRANPPYMTLFPRKLFSIYSLSCVILILRTPPYWSVSPASCNFILGNSFHCRSRTASDMTCKLGITFADESKDFYYEKSGQSSCRRAKRSWLVEVRRRKRFLLAGNC